MKICAVVPVKGGLAKNVGSSPQTYPSVSCCLEGRTAGDREPRDGTSERTGVWGWGGGGGARADQAGVASAHPLVFQNYSEDRGEARREGRNIETKPRHSTLERFVCLTGEKRQKHGPRAGGGAASPAKPAFPPRAFCSSEGAIKLERKAVRSWDVVLFRPSLCC